MQERSRDELETHAAGDLAVPRDVGRRRLERRSGLCRGNIVPESRQDLQRLLGAVGRNLGAEQRQARLERKPHVDAATDETAAEAAADNPHDGEWTSAHPDGPADHPRIGAEPVAPVVFRQQRRRRAGTAVVGGSDAPAGDHRHAKQLEVAAAGDLAEQLIGPRSVGHQHGRQVHGRHLRHAAIVLTQRAVVEIRERRGWRPAIRLRIEPNYTFGIRRGQRPEQDGVDEREDCRVESDRDAQRHRRGQPEGGLRADLTHREPQIADEVQNHFARGRGLHLAGLEDHSRLRRSVPSLRSVADAEHQCLTHVPPRRRGAPAFPRDPGKLLVEITACGVARPQR